MFTFSNHFYFCTPKGPCFRLLKGGPLGVHLAILQTSPEQKSCVGKLGEVVIDSAPTRFLRV